MSRTVDILSLPPGLPIPADDGMATHLLGLTVARTSLLATTGQRVDLSTLAGRTVVYCYPRTGRPDQELPDGWNLIPGARGCTPQSCAFRDHHRELGSLGARVFGLSTQDREYQREAVERLHLPFPLLSDAQLEFAAAMRLPAFDVQSIKRLTLIIRDGVVEHIFYPVFPPDRNAQDVIGWLLAHPETTLTIRRFDIFAAEAQTLIDALNAELSDRYPEPGANHFRLDAGEVTPGRGAFLIASRAGTPVGCGAIRRLDERTGEIKRMYVRPEERGRRVGRALLDALEAEARALGITRLVLETGDRQPEAIALYERTGFLKIAPFGEYAGSPLTVCMAKDL